MMKVQNDFESTVRGSGRPVEPGSIKELTTVFGHCSSDRKELTMLLACSSLLIGAISVAFGPRINLMKLCHFRRWLCDKSLGVSLTDG
jgi:hypothetical protein